MSQEPQADIRRSTPHGKLPGVIHALGLPEGTVVTQTELARLLNKHSKSVERAIQRGELPPPTLLMGTNVWTIGSIVEHLQQRLRHAAREVVGDTHRLTQGKAVNSYGWRAQ